MRIESKSKYFITTVDIYVHENGGVEPIITTTHDANMLNPDMLSEDLYTNVIQLAEKAHYELQGKLPFDFIEHFNLMCAATIIQAFNVVLTQRVKMYLCNN